jgi:hypothetical protein
MATNVGSYVGTAMSGSYGIVLLVILLGILGGFGYWIWLNKQYKYRIHLKVLKHGTFTVFDDTARSIKKDGEHFWKLRNLKELTSVPPPESILQTMGGKWEVEGYYERNIGVLWSRDTMTRTQFEALAKSLQERRKSDPNEKTEPIDTQYQPITSQERALQASQVTKAQLRKGKSGWEALLQLAPAFMILIVLILVVVFWNKIAAPVIELEKGVEQLSKTNAQIQQQNLRFYMMLTGGKGNGTYIVQQLPEDQTTFPDAFQEVRP